VFSSKNTSLFFSLDHGRAGRGLDPTDIFAVSSLQIKVLFFPPFSFLFISGEPALFRLRIAAYDPLKTRLFVFFACPARLYVRTETIFVRFIALLLARLPVNVSFEQLFWSPDLSVLSACISMLNSLLFEKTFCKPVWCIF